ncbi:hypothetical protein [Bifidobacterium primatium]|nr:hypothetical protein [Bifidobacterium primatium]
MGMHAFVASPLVTVISGMAKGGVDSPSDVFAGDDIPTGID